MKKLIAVLISGSLALAISAQARPDEGKKKKKGEQQAAQAARPAARPANVPHANARARQRVNANSAANQHAAQQRMQQQRAAQKASRKPATAAQVQSTLQSNPSYRKQHAADQNAAAKAQMNAKAEKANAAMNAKAENANARFQARADQQRKEKAQAKRPNAERLQAIRAQHKDFHAQARPGKIQAVTFNQDHSIRGADSWHGSHYGAFRDYRPRWHDRSWYHSHYNTVVLIGGGYYYWNSGYWYPAWGYAPSESYYAYDGPIYTGRVALPPDQVIANVQAVLQAQGYYTGEVDGLLGPLTREALSEYQADNGLYTTAAIDEPTLDSLGMNG